MQTNNTEIRILIKGKPVTEYRHNGDTFIEGRDGSEFEIEFINRNSFRVEAILSVDGLSITDGKEAGPNSAGYLVEANSTVRIPGWKLTDAQVASFYFAGKSGSYATQMTGSSQNNGVIGALVYREKHQVSRFMSQPTWAGGIVRGSNSGMHWSGEVNTSYSASGGAMLSSTANASPKMRGISKGIAQQAEPQNNLGTGFGEAQDFKTESVSFERGDIVVMMVIYYDNARGLKARGIQIGRPAQAKYNNQPQAFPSMAGCTPPPGWKG